MLLNNNLDYLITNANNLQFQISVQIDSFVYINNRENFNLKH